MSYLCFVCLFAYSGVFLLCLSSSCVLCTQCIVHFFISPSVFSNVYLLGLLVSTYVMSVVSRFLVFIVQKTWILYLIFTCHSL